MKWFGLVDTLMLMAKLALVLRLPKGRCCSNQLTLQLILVFLHTSN